MPDATTHPSVQELSDFGLGRLSAEAAATIAGHLETCPACQRAVAELPPDSFVGKVRAAHPGQTSIPGNRFAPGTETAAPPEGLPPELASYSKYRFVRELGRGGMGVVYLAEQTLMGRHVAVKVISPTVLAHPDALPRFQGEVKAAARLDHPNIVRAYDAEQVGSLHLLVMEYVDGTNLADLVQRKGPLPVAHACHFIRQAALGLQHAFEQGMVHRDIKPHNLMVTPKGQVKILDFGLARLRSGGRGLTEMGSFMGTPEYVSPEQAADARTADTRADLYSLGCTLYFLLTGRPPFPEDTAVKVILAHIEKEAPPVRELRPEVPAELGAVVARLLAKDPAQRYQQPVELARALVPFIKQGARREGVSSPPPVLPVSERRTVLGTNTSKVLKPQQNPAGKPPAPPAVVEHQRAAPFADLTDAAVPLTQEKRVRPGKGVSAAWYRRPPVLVGVAGAVLALGLLVGIILKVQTKDGTPGMDANESNRPAPLDCTGSPGVNAAAVKQAQAAWAKYLGRQVEEEDKIAPGVKMAFVLVPPGRFWMGSPPDEKGRDTDEAPHEVELTQPFYLGKYEVTQAQYEAVTGSNPSHFQGAELPVEKVIWEEADTFARKLTERRGWKHWYHLPTEAEWEYACRGGHPFSHPFGIGDGRLLSSNQANFAASGPLDGAATTPVGKYPANALGLYDMHGNVREWCADWYGDYPTAKATDPTGPEPRSSRVVRGGGWYDGAWNCRAAFRGGNSPGVQSNDLGFRLARVPSGMGK